MIVKKYHLYVGVLNTKTIQQAMEESFVRASQTHILIYKEGECPEGFKEITDENIYLLPSADIKWLCEVNIELMKQFRADHEEECRRAEEQFVKDFETELEAEKRKLSGQECDTV